MSSIWKRVANKRNAAHSTGPRTEAGKQISSGNSFKHGLTSSSILLIGEDAEEFEQFRRDLFAHWAPANGIERGLCEQIAENHWRALRSRNIETEFFNELLKQHLDADPSITPQRALARIFIDPKHQKEIALIMRYRREATSACDKARTALRNLKFKRLWAESARKEFEETLAKDAPQPEPLPEAGGFVSVNGPAAAVAPLKL